MTFILNILHKDFSLLVCDKQGNASGTTVLQAANGGSKITITAPKITINGINKLFTNKPRTLAVGIAGVYQDHTYASKLKDAEDTTAALGMIHAHIGTYLAQGNRRDVIEAKPVMQNQGLATFFDISTNEFFTDLFIFTPNETLSHIFYASANAPRLLHVGSGSSVLENAVGLDSINAFLEALKKEASPEMCLKWIAHAYEKVSEKAVGCGKEFTVLRATRDIPIFSELVTAT